MVTDWLVGGGGGTTFIIDPDGDIVWWHRSGVSNANVGRISEDSQSMWFTGASGFGASGLRRVSMDTLDQQTYDVPATHDLVALHDDCIAFNTAPNGAMGQIHQICSDDSNSIVLFQPRRTGGHGGAPEFAAPQSGPGHVRGLGPPERRLWGGSPIG